MKILHSISIILFYLSLVKNEYAHNYYSRLKKDVPSNNNCIHILEIKNCENGDKTVYRNQDLKIESTFKSCEKMKYTFDYELTHLNTGAVQAYHNNIGLILYVRKYSLDLGNYNVVLNVLFPNKTLFLVANKCVVTVKGTPLFPTMKNGFQRYVQTGRDIILNAKDSMDYANENPVDPKNIEYNWVYNCDKCTGFTSVQNAGPVLNIDGRKHLQETRYIVKLGIKSKWWPIMTYAYQVIYVRKSNPEIYLRCTVNCYSEYFDDGMEFVATCAANCPKNQKWLWRLYVAPDDDLSIIGEPDKLQLQFSREGGKVLALSMDDNMPPGKTYLLTASLNWNDTMASYKFKTMPDFDFGCSLIPSEGVVLETMFKVSCSGEGFGSLFWITLNDTKTYKEIKLQYDSDWKYLFFSVPRVGIVNLRFSHYSGLVGEVNWNPDLEDDGLKLTDKKLEIDEIDDSYNKGEDSVENSLDNFDYEKVLDKMTLISQSISDLNPSDVKKLEPTIDELISDIRKIPMTSINHIQQASGIMEDLTSVKTTFDPVLTKKMSSVCKDLSKEYSNVGKKQYLETKSETEILHTTISELMKCSVGVNRPNISAIEPKKPHVEVTTVNYIIDEEGPNTEVYDEYMDEIESSENKEQYKSVAVDFLEVCYNNGESLSRRINLAKEMAKDTKDVKTDDYTITAMKKYGYSLIRTDFRAFDINIIFPDDFSEDYRLYTVITCRTARNIFWWESNVEIISNILVIFVYRDEQEIKEYANNFEISFKVKTKPRKKFPNKTYNIDSNVSSRYDFHENKTLPIYIIALEAGKSLCLEFTELQDNVTLNVISTNFELPTPNDFLGDIQTISQENNFFVDDLINDYQGFRLISIAPSVSMGEKRIDFGMKAYAVSCVKWFPTVRLWKNSCKAKFYRENKSVVCSCKNLSVITATMEEVEVKEWQNYIPLNENLEEQCFFEIIIFMGSLCFLYCVMLCLAVMEVDDIQKTVYFLSDIVRHNRFGYLVVTKTGQRLDAGTTSNVIIRLIGKNAESQPHVLNYPDPLLKILQRGNEDWFFLATDLYLGKILEIELWYDSIGGLPSWYCSNVSVFDVQCYRWYKFKISSLFTIYPKPKVYVREKPYHISKDHSFKTKLIQMLNKFMPNFRIFNLSLRQTDESRSYVKRLTLMFSIVISIGFWCIILDGVPVGAPMDFIMKFCEYQVTWLTALYGIGGSIFTAFFHMPIVHLFTVSRVQFSSSGSFQKFKQSLIMTIFCWLFLIVLIIVHSTFIIFHGVRIPSVNAHLWMSYIIIGVMFYIFVIETISSNILRCVRGNFNENEYYVKQKITGIMNDIETQRDILYVMFGKYLLRPFLQHLYRPLQKAKIKFRWVIEKMKYDVRQLLENLVMFVIYTSLMYMVVLTHMDHQNINSNRQVSRLIEGSHTKSYPLDSVTSIRTLEEYIEKTLIESTQSRRWYGRYAVRDPGMTIDYSNKMMGVIRIRQHRSDPDSCIVPELMRFINRSCNSDYFDSQTFMDYGLRWSKTDPPPSEGRMKNIWRFTNSSETGTFPILGKLGFYSGGGYVAFLGRGMKNSHVNLDYLEEFSWFDALTRSIFIEFLLYNTNFNIFNAVRFTIEKSVTGYLKIKVKVETARMILVKEESLTDLGILLAIFVLLVTIFSIRTLIRIFRTGIWYFKDLWHLIDIVLISLSYTCIVLHYQRSSKVGLLLKSLEGVDPRDFVNYFSLLRMDNAFTLTAALLITVATVKLWLLFRFMIIFKIAERTLTNSFYSLCAIFTYHFIILLAFAVFGYVLFVDHCFRFADLINSIEYIFELNLRSFGRDDLLILAEPYMGLGYVFYISCSLSVLISNCIYSAMIIIYYSKAREDLSECPQLYTVQHYLKNQIQFYYNLLRVRLKTIRLAAGGSTNESTTPVSPKSDEYRYADSMTLSFDKLRAMSLVSLCVLSNSNPKRKPLSQKDIRLMTHTLYYLRKIQNEPENNDEGERFYKCHLGGNEVKLVPEFQLTKIEAAARILLGQSSGETIKKLNINGDCIIEEEISQRMEKLKSNLTIMANALNKISLEMI